jgi:hypothetical protein
MVWAFDANRRRKNGQKKAHNFNIIHQVTGWKDTQGSCVKKEFCKPWLGIQPDMCKTRRSLGNSKAVYVMTHFHVSQSLNFTYSGYLGPLVGSKLWRQPSYCGWSNVHRYADASRPWTMWLEKYKLKLHIRFRTGYVQNSLLPYTHRNTSILTFFTFM